VYNANANYLNIPSKISENYRVAYHLKMTIFIIVHHAELFQSVCSVKLPASCRL